jgi:hypothetical protein
MNTSLQLRQLRTVACWFWGRMLCLSLSVVLPVTCSALEIQHVQTCSGIVLRLRGDIKEGDFSRLKSHFRRKEAIVGFDLSSDGGVLEEGLLIADLTRRKKLTVYIAGECNSTIPFARTTSACIRSLAKTRLAACFVSDLSASVRPLPSSAVKVSTRSRNLRAAIVLPSVRGSVIPPRVRR